MYQFRNSAQGPAGTLEPLIKIDKENYHDLKFWSEELCVHRRTLEEAVKAVGPFLHDIKKHLGIS